jgi:hypothetical protein
VYKDRSWLADVPPYLPLHLQPIDKFGLAIRNQQLWIQGMPGETRRCVGCHESRTGQGVPVYGQNPTVAEQQGARPFTQAIADRIEFPWDKKVQPILDAKCVSCHNSTTTDYYLMTRTDPLTGLSTTYKIPTLDLTSAPVTVYYDKRVASWPASYVSIFYAASLEMGDNGMAKVTVTGSTPAVDARLLAGDYKWGIPGSARASKLTQKLNLRAPDGTTTAWMTPLHPEDKQVQLSDDERKTIAVYPMDLGGQFYARQNSAFVPFIYGDAVTPVH